VLEEELRLLVDAMGTPVEPHRARERHNPFVGLVPFEDSDRAWAVDPEARDRVRFGWTAMPAALKDRVTTIVSQRAEKLAEEQVLFETMLLMP
jgi:hypothetical protein